MAADTVPEEPGLVGVRHFDQAVVDQLGDVEVIELDDKTKTYAIAISGVPGMKRFGGKIPIRMIPVNVAYVPDFIPSIVVRPLEPAPALDRYHPSSQTRWPTPGAAEVTVEDSLGVEKTGFRRYRHREAPFPFDISYEVQLYAQTRNQGVAMLMYALQRFQPYGQVTVKDTKGVERTYESFMESVANISELDSIVERLVSHSISLRVAGELDIGSDVDIAAMTAGTVDLTTGTM